MACYRKKCLFCSKILDSLMAWLGEKRKTEFSWTPAIQAVSESRIFEQNKHFSRYFISQSAPTSKYGIFDICSAVGLMSGDKLSMSFREDFSSAGISCRLDSRNCFNSWAFFWKLFTIQVRLHNHIIFCQLFTTDSQYDEVVFFYKN